MQCWVLCNSECCHVVICEGLVPYIDVMWNDGVKAIKAL